MPYKLLWTMPSTIIQEIAQTKKNMGLIKTKII